MIKYIKTIYCQRVLAWLVFLLYAKFSIDRLRYSFSIILGKSTIDYNTFDISDWLINYESGFIRRGIMGQILWNIEQFHLYDVRMAITIICVASSFAILFLVYRVFKEEGWSFLIIPTGFIFGFTIFGLGGRRDLLSLLITYAIFYSFKNIFSRTDKRHLWWFVFYSISILQILIHEASFFYTFPILMLFLFLKNKDDQLSFRKNCTTGILQFIPIFIAMAIVCIFKGNQETANIIWNSWNKIFIAFPDNDNTTSIGDGVNALSWGAQETFINHLKAGYIGTNSPSFIRIPIVLFNILAAYLLVTRINTIDMGIYKNKQMNHVLMSNVLLIQVVAMIPMFTVLSCDWGRTIPYWLLSSLFFYHIFKDEKIEFLHHLTKTSQITQNYISYNPLLRNKYTYLLLVLLSPIPGACAPFDSANTFQQGFIVTFQSILNNLITYLH